MNLYQEILINMLRKEEIHITFPNLMIDAKEVVGMECYQVLEKIKGIIEDDNLSDFMCVEGIVCLLESIGSCGGSRHDF